MIRLQRQVCYCGDQEGLDGLKTHLGDDEISLTILNMLWEDRHEPYILCRPFTEWEELKDTAFRDLILRLMNLDLAKRITAQQALEHACMVQGVLTTFDVYDITLFDCCIVSTTAESIRCSRGKSTKTH